MFAELCKTPALSGADLLVLSACDTATPTNQGADGAETESFARIAMEGGAAAVLATLWPVNDAGTSALMRKFYELRKSGLGKLEALRQAQLWMRDTAQTTSTNSTGRSTLGSDPSGYRPKTVFKPFPVDPAHPYAHPYYWAAFVLTGNTK